MPYNSLLRPTALRLSLWGGNQTSHFYMLKTLAIFTPSYGWWISYKIISNYGRYYYAEGVSWEYSQPETSFKPQGRTCKVPLLTWGSLHYWDPLTTQRRNNNITRYYSSPPSSIQTAILKSLTCLSTVKVGYLLKFWGMKVHRPTSQANIMAPGWPLT